MSPADPPAARPSMAVAASESRRRTRLSRPRGERAAAAAEAARRRVGAHGAYDGPSPPARFRAARVTGWDACPPPRSRTRRHVVVVGGGIAGLAGLAAARGAARRGRDVLRARGRRTASAASCWPASRGRRGRRRRRVDARAPARGRRPRARAGPRRRSSIPPTTSRSGLDPRRAAAVAAPTLMGVPADLERRRARAAARPAGVAGCRDGRRRRRSPTARTSRSASWSPPGSARGRRPAGRAAARRRVRRPARTLSAAGDHARSWSALLRRAAARWSTAPRRRGRAGAGRGPPVFAGIAGGVGRLPLRRRRRAGRRDGPHRAPWCASSPHADGWRLVVGPDRARRRRSTPTRSSLAVPAAPAARLLADVAPAAASELGRIEYASMAVVTLAFAAADFAAPRRAPASSSRRSTAGRSRPPPSPSPSGTGSARPAPACWCCGRSVGRHREEAALQVHRRGPGRRVAGRPGRGHRARGRPRRQPRAALGRRAAAVRRRATSTGSRRIRAAVAAVPGLAVCGAAYDGVGIPAVHRLGPRGRPGAAAGRRRTSSDRQR